MTPPESAGPPPPPVATPASDRLVNLRRVAAKKNSPFATELALFHSDLIAELDEFAAALHQEDGGKAGHYAHLLCGRWAFVGENELEAMVRGIERSARAGQWPEARRLAREFQASLAEWRFRLGLAAPVVPPG